MRSFTDRGIVINKKDFGEAARILTILTQGHGKIRVLAKGIRRPLSRKGGNLDLLNLVNFHVVRGRNLDLVTAAKCLESFSGLKVQVKNISKAYYLCEVVDRLCPENQELSFVYDLLV